MGRYLICITGASGAMYGARTMQALVEAGHEVHAIWSAWGERLFMEETGTPVNAWLAAYADINPAGDGPDASKQTIIRHDAENLAAPPSSGSWQLSGTIIVPASMSTVGAVASGATTNLIHRAAAVALKERRPLVIVPREAPLSLIDLRNLTTLAEAGASILPASPGFYHHPATISDLIDFVTGKILDHLGVGHGLVPRWGE